MKKININANGMNEVPPLVIFQGAPSDNFANGEEVLIQLVNQDGENVGKPAVRVVVKTHEANENESAWYEGYIPR